jgi:hypothetical protein
MNDRRDGPHEAGSGSGCMRGRKLRSGSLMALVGALILVLGAAPGLAQRKPPEIYETIPDKSEMEHRANRVTVMFKEALVEQGVEGKETTITVEDACGRLLSNSTTQRAMAPAGEEAWVERAFVDLDRRTKNPNGVYSVFVTYWLASDEVENPQDPNEPDPPNQEPRTYAYSFQVHGGPNCDGSPKPGHGGHGGGDKKQVWGNTSGTGHDSNGGHVGHDNLRTATGSTTDHTTDHTTTDFSSFTSPLISSSDDHSPTHTGSTTPFGEDDFGDPFGDTTGTPPLSDPTDPSLYESEPGEIPEEAEDQQTLSAAPADDIEPEPSMLVVALALALLLGVGGGLFLRKTDPAPIRS